MLKLASKVIEFVPAQIVLDGKPDLKSAIGDGPAWTVIVTVLEMNIFDGTSHKSPLKLALASLLYAVVKVKFEGL